MLHTDNRTGFERAGERGMDWDEQFVCRALARLVLGDAEYIRSQRQIAACCRSVATA